jgi:hypothetical protein
MTEHQTSRTLVKSAPELWAECSDAASLARHLGAFGEIRITKLEPETAVAWEGTAASGTVTLEPAGWGTRVTLTVTEERLADEPAAIVPEPVDHESQPLVEPEQTPEPEPEPEPEPPEPELEPVAKLAPEIALGAHPRARRMGRLRLMFRRRPAPVGEEPPAAVESPVADHSAPPAADDPAPAVADKPGPAVADTPGLTVADKPAPAVADSDRAPEPAPARAPAPEPEAAGGEDALAAALDSLGRAHHRPYSRA